MKPKENIALKQKRLPLVDITNYDLRKHLRDELSLPSASAPNRQASAPASRKKKPSRDKENSDSTAKDTSTRPSFLRHRASVTTPSLTSDTSIDHEPLLSLPTVTHEPLVFSAHPLAISLKPLQGGRAKSSMTSTSSNDRVAPALNILQSDHMLGSNVPIGACRPTPLTTNQMTVKTYKTAQGQVVVLPSRSLLVDFRERDRRNGNAGDEVLIISADGVRVTSVD